MRIRHNHINIFFLCVVALAIHACGFSDSSPEGRPVPAHYAQADSSLAQSTSLQDQADTAIITHRARIQTSFGKITLVLFGKDAPLAVDNFVTLARRGKYNRVLFHRVVKDFFVQTGDPKTRLKKKRDEWGTGGESIYGKPFEDELYPETPSYRTGYTRGTVAMANSGAHTNTSQFFICLTDVPDLPKNFTIFGKVVEGMAVVDSIASVAIEPIRDAEDGMPIEPIVITSVKISTVRNKR